MRRLRLYFSLFSVLLAIPIAVLLWRTYANLEKEAFFFYRSVAEGLVATVSDQLLRNLKREEQRPFTHYRFFHVAERPVPKQEGLNLSPLASFPVDSEVPGILGYFQIEPDGTFQTPLLPTQSQESAIEVSQESERVELKSQLSLIIEGRRIRSPADLQGREKQVQETVESKDKALSNLKKNLESNVNLRLDQEYSQEDSERAGIGQLAEAEEKAEDDSFFSFQRRVQNASPKQVEVFESQLADSATKEEADELAPTHSREGRASPAESFRVTRTGPGSIGEVDADFSDGAEVDPFAAYLVGKEWLVLERKVWWQDHRYIQGFVADLARFLGAFLGPQLENSVLPETASYLLFHEGDLIWPQNRETRAQKPDLLFSEALPHPLSEFHLAITVDELPDGPGYQTANWLAALLSVLFAGGLFGIYRLTSTQMELSQKKGDFVAAVSHELKSPLTAIQMYGEILLEGWADDEKRETYYRHIHDESERLGRLIQNLLTLSQLEKSEWQSDLTELDPVIFVEEVVEKLEAQVKRAGFEIRVTTEGEPKTVRADRDALIQILINLIDNAIKFAGKSAIREIVLNVSQVGAETSISVRDFGPGVPRRKLKKIFERFYRVDDEMTRTTRGTGIGLALVRMLADSMGAQADVRNRNPGAEFSIGFR